MTAHDDEVHRPQALVATGAAHALANHLKAKQEGAQRFARRLRLLTRLRKRQDVVVHQVVEIAAAWRWLRLRLRLLHKTLWRRHRRMVLRWLRLHL